MLQISESVSVGPGVVDARVVGTLVGAAVVSVVWMVVGAGVAAAGAVGWVHPATSARTMHSISVNTIVILFIPHVFTGGYLRVLSSKVMWPGFPARNPEMRIHFFHGVRGSK